MLSKIRFGVIGGGCAIFLLTAGGCATSPSGETVQSVSSVGEVSRTVDWPDGENVPPVQIREFFLSPGDEISITVLGYPDLNRRMAIPPDGRFFYPMVGEVDIQGKTLRQLRETLTEGLSRFQENALAPGDEISISVYRNDELNRKLIIPPDGRFFFPLVGEIDTKGKTLTEIRGIMTSALTKFVVDPQVSVDLVASDRPKVIPYPQVSVEVTSFGGQKIFVLGEVNRPGVFTVDGGVDLVEAVTRAGGFTLDARQDNVLLVRGDGEKPDLHLFDLEKFLKGADLTQNATLQRGDVIYVPPSRIANVDRFFRHFETIIRPIVTLETGIVLGPAVDDAINGTTGRTSTVIVPPR